MNQTKRDRFVRIAEQRTQKVLDDLRSLGNCSARESYEYTNADVEKIITAIENELQNVRDRFAGIRPFSLSDPEKECKSPEHSGLDSKIQAASLRASAKTDRTEGIDKPETMR